MPTQPNFDQKPADEARLTGALNEIEGNRPSPTLRRDAMANDMMKRQSLTADGAVEGAGGYVYKPMPDGTVTILFDPSGAATGVNLGTGEAYSAIKAELMSKGIDLNPAAVGPDDISFKSQDDIAAEGISFKPKSEVDFADAAASGDARGMADALGGGPQSDSRSPTALADTALGPQSDQPGTPALPPGGPGRSAIVDQMGSEIADKSNAVAGEQRTEIKPGTTVVTEPPKEPTTKTADAGKGGSAFTPPTAENDRFTGPSSDTAPTIFAEGMDPAKLARAALDLPEGDPRREQALANALKGLVG